MAWNSERRRIKLKQLRRKLGDYCIWCKLIMRFPTGKEDRRNRPVDATIEHFIPLSRGGTNEFSNLRLAHSLCNGQRDGSPMTKIKEKIKNKVVMWLTTDKISLEQMEEPERFELWCEI